MKPKQIQVLHVDDDKNFAEVASTILSDEGPFNIEIATSTKEALKKLQNNVFDVIISDYEMPEKNGLELLQIIRQKGFTTPFILFTGKGREEIAVQALNLGVDRYINKHGNPQTVYTELTVAIRQLLEKTLAQKKLWESEERFKQMVTHNKDLIMLTGNDGKILYLSPACKDVLGYEPNELIGKMPWIIHPDDLEYVQRVFQSVLTTELSDSVEYRIITKQGKTKWVNHSFSQIIENAKVKQIVSTVKDIAEAKFAQEKLVESKERFRLLIENSPVMMAELDRDLQYVWVHNPRIRPNLSEKVLGKRFGEQVNMENVDQIRKELEELLKNAGSIRKEITLHDDRGTIFLDCRFETALNPQGEISGLRFTAYDITERKKMLNQLSDSEERWNFALEGAGQGVWDIDAQGKKVFLSKKWKSILGYNEDEIKNESSEWIKLIHPDDKQNAIKTIENFLTGKTNTYAQEYRLLSKDGTYKHIFSQGKAISRTSEGKAVRVIGTIMDITDHHKAEVSLKESEEKFFTAFNSSGAALVISRLDDGIILDVNECFLEVFEFNREEVIGKTAQSLNLYADSTERQQIINLTLKNQQVINREVKGRKKDKTEVTVLFSTKIFNIKGQKHLLTTLIDISNLKKAEKALFFRQKELENFFAIAPDAVIVGDLKGKILECNELSTKTFGYTKEEIIGSNGLMFIEKTKREQLVKEFENAIKNKQVQTNVFNCKCKNGKEICVEASIKAIYDNQENPTGFISIIRDITERNLTKQKLLESEERYRFMAEHAQDIITVTDIEGNFIFVSPSIQRLTGFNPEELVGKKTVMSCIHEDFPHIDAYIRNLTDDNIPIQIEMRFLTKQGQYIWLESNINPVKDSTGRAKFITISRDITQRRNDHEERNKALAQAELLLEKLSVVGGFVRHDVRNKLTTITSTLYLCKKYAEVNQNRFMKTHIEQIEHVSRNIERILEFSQTYETVGSQGLSWCAINKAIEDAKGLVPNITNVEVTTENTDFDVLADSALVEIFHNLLENSVKYGNNLQKIRIFSQKNTSSSLELVYEDNGGGIDPEIKARLFQKGAGKGTGLGLYLIQRISDIYGWKVSENGELGRGARFVIEIPKEKTRKTIFL